jgi:hypothetical protein
MRRAPRDSEPARRWLSFLRNHREAVAAMDFFRIPTITFHVLYCFFVISHVDGYPSGSDLDPKALAERRGGAMDRELSAGYAGSHNCVR